MFLTLLVIALVSGASLGFVYNFTKGPIDLAKAAKQQEAVKLVVPEFDNDPIAEAVEVTSDEGFVLKMFPAKKGGQLVGTAVETMTNRGFSGEIKVMVGFDPQGTLINYKVLDHKETPGLGSKMDEWFRPAVATAENHDAAKPSFFKWLYGIKGGGGGNRSVIGKNPGSSNLTVSKDGGEVDAITAATISSRAFMHSIKVAYDAYVKKMTASVSDNAATDSLAIQTNQEGGLQ